MDKMITAEAPPESVNYKLEQSAALAIGVDLDETRGAEGQGASKAVSTCSRDIKHVVDCLTNVNVIPRENWLVYTSQSDHDQCTIDGVKKAFQQQLSKVSENGLFLLAFSGLAVTVVPNESAAPQCSLKLVDFNASDVATHLTASTISEWIASSPTKPKHVLLILDNPFAKKFAQEMIEVGKNRSAGTYSLCMLSALDGPEKSFVLDTLGHSIFNYFLTWAFHTTAFTPGLIPLRSIYKKVQELCTALSSLIVTYSPEEYELKQNVITPGANYITTMRKLLGDDSDEADGVVAQYEFLTKNFVRSNTARKVKLHDKVHAYLETVGALGETSALTQLNKHGLLEQGEVILSVISSLMFSIASIQVAEDKKSLSDPNLFIVSFLTSTATVCSVKSDLELTPVDLFRRSRNFYLQVVRENGVDDKKLDALFRKVDSETKVAIN